jgi:dual specificity protein phosphatase-like protein
MGAAAIRESSGEVLSQPQSWVKPGSHRVRAACWLAFLAPFFYATYGLANAIAARRHGVPSVVFAWERHIPFLEWSIVPYWSIDVFYGLSLFVCATRAELAIHVRRLLTAQVAAVVAFVLFPLEFTFHQPEAHGIPGVLFGALRGFDKPFNQAPSLHIAILVILWPLYSTHAPRALRWPLHVWFVAVGASVLTTYQHHFLDVPTGVLLGAACLWLWPDRAPSPLATMAFAIGRARWVAGLYFVAAASLAGLALRIGGAGLWLWWPAVSLLLVAANYAVFGPAGFQKDRDGRMSLAARLLLAPYLAAAFVNSRCWTLREPQPVRIDDGVWLGRMPLAPREAAAFSTVVDVCAELPGARGGAAWACVPMLDLVAPPAAQLRAAVATVERARSAGPVLVCCALGYSRSAATVAAWLIARNPTKTTGDALDRLRRARPRVVIGPALSAAIVAAAGR